MLNASSNHLPPCSNQSNRLLREIFSFQNEDPIRFRSVVRGYFRSDERRNQTLKFGSFFFLSGKRFYLNPNTTSSELILQWVGEERDRSFACRIRAQIGQRSPTLKTFAFKWFEISVVRISFLRRFLFNFLKKKSKSNLYTPIIERIDTTVIEEKLTMMPRFRSAIPGRTISVSWRIIILKSIDAH